MRVILQSARRALGALSSPPLPLWAPGGKRRVCSKTLYLYYGFIFFMLCFLFLLGSLD